MTILYHHPQDPQAFERYYAETHLPLAAKVKGIGRLELTRFGPGSDASKPAYYRMAELYFPDQAQLEASLGSPEGQTTVSDMSNFATGGVTLLTGSVES